MPGVTARILTLVPALIATAWLGALPAARADTTAVTPNGTAFSGVTFGAVGFSFTATTNLAVSAVGYYDSGIAAPVIKFWAATNYVFASFNLPPGSNSHSMIYSNVSLTLLAGQSYTVTLEDATGAPTAFNGVTNFQVAAELGDYTSATVSSGAFSGSGPGYYFQGPDFLFIDQAASVTSPDLTILQQSPTNVLLLWPASPSGFILQDTPSLDTPVWTVVTNAVTTVNGTNAVSDVLGPGNSFYRLYHP